ncbi:MAG TPA: thioredoxin family protein [Candidatus Limnocylindria bacterium]
MRVELLYADGDPAAMPARQNLVEVLTEDAFETPIQMIAVATEADAELLGMRGSPAIRIDGQDIIVDWDGPFGLAPRDYGDGPVPAKDLIRAAVDRARGWSHARPSRPGG